MDLTLCWRMDMRMLETAKQQAEICKLFGNVHRILILWVLENQELSVSDIAREIDSSLQNTSQHLRLMKAKGMVASRRDGHTIYYRIPERARNESCRCLRNVARELAFGTHTAVDPESVLSFLR